MSDTIPGNAAGLFSQFLAALRDEGHHLPLSDAAAAQMIADALDVLDPDDATEGEEDVAAAVGYFANSFASVAADLSEDSDDA